ncbi:isochorismatase family cysteine hydrolase [Nocardia sp. NPDC060249]|uniref:isochorismatase family cysteine hydrolase n=1 Tax=Nocardia sp. NPDC060249 TaxID=3347082 RepID=UPI00365236E1
MNIDNAALIVIDVQNGFITPDSAPVVPVVDNLIRSWAPSGQPIVITRFANYPNSPYERHIGWTALQSPEEIAVVDELAPHLELPNVTVIDKQIYSAFTPETITALRDLAVTDVILCGIATDACVLKSALDAFELGWTPWVVRDAVASNATRHRADQVHEAALLIIGRSVGAGQIITSTEVLNALNGHSTS